VSYRNVLTPVPSIGFALYHGRFGDLATAQMLSRWLINTVVVTWFECRYKLLDEGFYGWTWFWDQVSFIPWSVLLLHCCGNGIDRE
jgi:hypothetical protein